MRQLNHPGKASTAALLDYPAVMYKALFWRCSISQMLAGLAG